MKKVVLAMLAVSISAAMALAADRPGTPLKSMETKAAISQDQAAQAVERYVNDIKKDKGTFMMKDDKTGEQVSLTYDKVNKDDISHFEKDKYYVPATFKSADGKSYMVDFILKPELMGDEIKVSESSIRKVDGVERYQWKQEGDSWKKDTSAAAAGAAERKTL